MEQYEILEIINLLETLPEEIQIAILNLIKNISNYYYGRF